MRLWLKRASASFILWHRRGTLQMRVISFREETNVDTGGMSTELDQIVAFLRGGVRRPDLEQGLRVIETWEQRLAASGSPDLVPVAENLAELRTILLAGDFDPAAVGRLLVTLGEQVEAVAESDVGAPVADRLLRLSSLLADQGGALTGD
jgi:hypothetical protein